MDPDQQVARLEKLIVRLGGFPDRDLIHQITECGRLGLRTGGQALAERMCAAIMDVLDDGENGATAAERRVPLFYALDSVVKNVGDVFQPLLSVRVRAAFGRAFAACAEKDKTRLHHVLRTWNEKSIFIEVLDDLNALVAPWHAVSRSVTMATPGTVKDNIRDLRKTKEGDVKKDLDIRGALLLHPLASGDSHSHPRAEGDSHSHPRAEVD